MQPDSIVHNSAEGWLELEDRPVGNFPRPTGLWFARGDTWISYASRANPMYARAQPHVFELDFGTANLLTIDSERTADWFTHRYGRTDVKWIDWSAVAKDFDGIEITDQNLIQRHMWSRQWEVASGCCWNASKMKVVGYSERPEFRRITAHDLLKKVKA